MSPADELIPILKKLRLSGVMQSLELRQRQAVDDNLDIAEFLHRVLSDEVGRRLPSVIFTDAMDDVPTTLAPGGSISGSIEMPIGTASFNLSHVP